MCSKMIKDPIHGFIEFEGESELELKNILSDPLFQRLRRVKQLGFSDYVFPSATHSRFAHSLGVYSVAKKMLSIVEPESQHGNWSLEGKACLAAALLHDVGHGMFSHAFEKAMEFYFKRNPDPNGERTALRDAVNHEKVSHKIITQSSITKLLSQLGGKEFPSLVAAMINKSREGCIYTSIVSGQLDADRLDYAKRDPYFAGVSSGGIDLDWLIRNLKKGENESGGEYLYVDSKAYVSLEQFTVTLFQLYPTLYLHKRTRGLEYMFALLMSRVFELIEQRNEAAAGLDSKHPFVRFFYNPDNIENFMLLDDTLFWGALYLFKEAPDISISTIARRIAERDIYSMIDIWKVVEEAAASNDFVRGLTAFERLEKLHTVCSFVAQEIAEDKDVWLGGCYYDTYDRPIYKPLCKAGGDPQQINVKVGGKIVDIASISSIVASAASFNIHRIYYDDQVAGQEDKLRSAIRSSVERQLKELVK
ncbi:MAG: HD domain-containing protein [Desulfuromonas sp.]|jgi:HD superfamily phosphohydrolase|nr:HD domain-containing protein [Desulfuromonas sp.]